MHTQCLYIVGVYCAILQLHYWMSVSMHDTLFRLHLLCNSVTINNHLTPKSVISICIFTWLLTHDAVRRRPAVRHFDVHNCASNWCLCSTSAADDGRHCTTLFIVWMGFKPFAKVLCTLCCLVLFCDQLHWWLLNYNGKMPELFCALFYCISQYRSCAWFLQMNWACWFTLRVCVFSDLG